MRWIAFLRGINVGSANRVGMPALREALAEAGHPARTLLQSGNVVIDTTLRSERTVGRAVADAVRGCSGLEIPVVVRSPEQLEAVAALDPHGAYADDPKRSSVSFLDQPLANAVAAELLVGDYGEDRLAIDGRELYLWTPGGLRESKLAAAVARPKAAGHATNRNWNTLTKTIEFARQDDAG